MPVGNQAIGSTAAKSGTLQYVGKRLQGLPLVVPSACTSLTGVAYVTNRRIVSIQQKDSNGLLYAVVSPVAISGYKIVGWGVLEEALQSGGLASIAPTPNTYVDGDIVTVLCDTDDVYMIDGDGSNTPTNGIGTAYMDAAGRITSVSSGSNLLLGGAVFTGLIGNQLSGQLASGCVFYRMYSPLKP